MTHAERQWTGQIWDLTTTDGRWVVTALADFVAPAHIETEAELVERAIAAWRARSRTRAHDRGAVRPRARRHQLASASLIQLGPPSPQPPLPQIAAEGERILARIHRLDLEPPEPVVPWLTQRWTELHWQRLVDKARAADKVWAADFARFIPGSTSTSCATGEIPTRGPFSPRRGAPTAVRLAGADRLIAVGWERERRPQGLGPRRSPHVVVRNRRERLRPAAARAFLDGYRELADDIDVTLPMFTSGLTAALNWTISRPTSRCTTTTRPSGSSPNATSASTPATRSTSTTSGDWPTPSPDRSRIARWDDTRTDRGDRQP